MPAPATTAQAQRSPNVLAHSTNVAIAGHPACPEISPTYGGRCAKNAPLAVSAAEYRVPSSVPVDAGLVRPNDLGTTAHQPDSADRGWCKLPGLSSHHPVAVNAVVRLSAF